MTSETSGVAGTGASWVPGGPSLIELRDQSFDRLDEAATTAIRAGRSIVEVDARDLIGLVATWRALQETERAGRRPRSGMGHDLECHSLCATGQWHTNHLSDAWECARACTCSRPSQRNATDPGRS